MDLKSVLSNFEPLLETHDTLTAEQKSDLRNTVDTYCVLKKRIKTQKEEKQAINAQFKLAKGDSYKIAELKLQSKTIVSQIKEAEAQLKTLGTTLLENLAPRITVAHPWPPVRFNLPAEFPPPFQFQVRLATDADAPRWDAFVESHPRASAYHAFTWRTLIKQAFGHDSFYYLAETETGEIVGILPCTWLNSKLFGNFGASVPFFNYGGPLSDYLDIQNALIDVATREAKQLHWQHLELRTCQPLLNYPSTQHKASMILPLPESESILDDNLGAKVRAQFNQATSHPLTVKFGKQELLDDFYQVFAQNMRDLGTPVYAKSFFETIFKHFNEQATIVVTYFDGKPAGTGFLFGYKGMLEIPWASTIKRYNRFNVNMWMYRQILGFAITQGYDYFDFGRSSVDAGTYKFKKQWGAQPIQHYWYYWLNEGNTLPQLNPNNPKYKLAIAVWQRLPVFLTKWIGPPLVKYIP